MDPHFQTLSSLPLHFNTVRSITLTSNLPSVYSLVPDILETLGNFPALFGLPTPPTHLSPSKEPINKCCNANSESEESEGQVLAAEGMSV